jgi:Zn-finger nucleic acid-binding protein
MICPACGDPLENKHIPTKGGGKLNLKVCKTCGGTWADQGVANRLTPQQAESLANQLRTMPGLKLTDPVCSRCGIPMEKLRAESIPPDVIVYGCPKCGGNWFPAGELSRLRKAQWLKLEYLKAFNIPFGSFATVLLPILLLGVLSLGVFYTARKMSQPTYLTSQAEDVIRNLEVEAPAANSVKISFFTNKPSKSYLKFVIGGQSGRLTISDSPRRYHEIQVSNIARGDLFQISLEPKDAQPFSTSPQPFIN